MQSVWIYRNCLWLPQACLCVHAHACTHTHTLPTSSSVSLGNSNTESKFSLSYLEIKYLLTNILFHGISTGGVFEKSYV